MSALVSKPSDARYYVGGPNQGQDDGSKSLWLGAATDRFGLTDVHPRHFVNLWRGLEPHGGKPILKSHNSPDRVPAYDLVNAFDHSMKLLVFAPEHLRGTVEECEMAAYKKVAAILQERCGWTRTGHGGKNQMRAEIPMMLKRELVSRWDGAPFPHAHLIAFAAVISKDGKVRSLDGSHLFNEQKVLNAVLNLEYANQLSTRLDLRVIRKGNQAALPGHFDALLRVLSPASETIKRVMKENGYHSPKAAAILAQKLKPTKEIHSLHKLRVKWERIAARHGFRFERLERRRPVQEFTQSLASPEFRKIKHAEIALTNLTRTKSLVTERKLLTEALLSAIGKNLSVRQVMEGVEHVVRSQQIYSLGQVKGSPAFTTKAVWKSERRTLRHAEALAKKDRLIVTRDPARGAGDYIIWGRHLKVVRPENVESLLNSFDKGPRLNAHWEAFRAARGTGFGFDLQARLKAAELAYREARKPVSKVDSKTLYLVEDIHRIPTESLERLLKHVRRAGAKVILHEPPHGATKAVSGILPQLLDLNREGKLRNIQERRQVIEQEMRFIH
jgi:hypothetical protein